MAKLPPYGTWVRRLVIGLTVSVTVLLIASPGRIQSRSIESMLERELGFPVQVSAARWRFDPWPAIEVSGAVAFPDWPGSWPIGITAEKIVCRGLSGLQDEGGELSLSGLSLRYGPIALQTADLELSKQGSNTTIEGHADGSWGGSIELRGQLGNDPAQPLRIYLNDLVLSLEELMDPGFIDGPGRVRLNGVVTVVGNPEGHRDIRLDLSLEATRQEGRPPWLAGRIDGGWLLENGVFQPGRRARIDVEIRDVSSGDELRVVHGDVGVDLELSGNLEQGTLRILADLEGLRVRMGGWFEKRSGSEAVWRHELRWGRGVRRSSSGEIRIGGLLLRAERGSSADAGVWKIRSGSLPLAELRKYLPALHDLPPESDGQLVLEAEWEPERGVEGRAVLRRTRIGSGTQSLEVPFARFELGPEGLRVMAPEVSVAGQRFSLGGRLEWVPSPYRWRIDLDIEADQLDLDPLLELISVLWEDAGLEYPISWEDAAREIVRTLRADPRMLARLQVQPAVARIRHLEGMGFNMRQAHFRLELLDRQLKLQRSDASAQSTAYALDLGTWFPKLMESD